MTSDLEQMTSDLEQMTSDLGQMTSDLGQMTFCFDFSPHKLDSVNDLLVDAVMCLRFPVSRECLHRGFVYVKAFNAGLQSTLRPVLPGYNQGCYHGYRCDFTSSHSHLARGDLKSESR